MNRAKPDLESLKLSFSSLYREDIDGETLRFNNTKKFKCGGSVLWGHIERIPLEFGNLEEIELNSGEFTRHFIELMMQNLNLKKVVLNFVVNRNLFDRIANVLLKLEELVVKYDNGDSIPVPDIVQFMNNASQLKSISFLELPKARCTQVAEQLNDQWENAKKSKKHCSFVRI